MAWWLWKRSRSYMASRILPKKKDFPLILVHSFMIAVQKRDSRWHWGIAEFVWIWMNRWIVIAEFLFCSWKRIHTIARKTTVLLVRFNHSSQKRTGDVWMKPVRGNLAKNGHNLRDEPPRMTMILVAQLSLCAALGTRVLFFGSSSESGGTWLSDANYCGHVTKNIAFL